MISSQRGIGPLQTELTYNNHRMMLIMLFCLQVYMCINLKGSTLLIIILLLSVTSALNFTFTLKSNTKRCFSQLLTESTPFHFRTQSQDDQYDISLNHKDGTPLFINNRTERNKKIDSYASVTSEYYLCILNKDYNDKNITFHFYHGIELSDLTSLPKMQDSKIIDEVVDKINEVYQIVKQQQSYSKTVNEYNMELQKLVSFKSVGFVFLSITVVLIISFLHYLEIKRVLKNRKII